MSETGTPSWQLPYGTSVATPAEIRVREDYGIRDALLEVAGPAPRTRNELFAEVRDEWGWEPTARLEEQLQELVRAGRMQRERAGFVRR